MRPSAAAAIAAAPAHARALLGVILAATLLLAASLLLGALPALAGGDLSPLPSPGASSAPASPEGSPAAAAPACPEASPAPGASASPGAPASPGSSAAPDGAASSPDPAASPDPCAPATSVLDLGEDGRLTVLLLGSDYREFVDGERMDVVMVASLDPVTKRVVAVNLPRDLVQVPKANGRTSGSTRVNALYNVYKRLSLSHEQVDRRAMNRFRKDIAAALGVEIDYWAMTRFFGFRRMVEELGGIRVDIDEEIHDDYVRRVGAYFPARENYRLGDTRNCRADRPCHDALIYVRSRHGTQGDRFNSDYRRAERQQEVVLAAAERAVSAGFTPRQLAALLKVARKKVATDMPMTVEAATELLRLVDGATLRQHDRAVFGPSTFAYTDETTARFTYRLRLDKVRAWMRDRFGLDADPTG